LAWEGSEGREVVELGLQLIFNFITTMLLLLRLSQIFNFSSLPLC